MGILADLLSPGLRAATPENPRFSLNDPAAWDALLSGAPSSTGLPVNGDIALSYAPWWKAVNLLATDVAKLSLHVFRSESDTNMTADRLHPAYSLLRRKPNPYQTAFVFKRQLTGHALTRGNGYAYIDRDGAGRPLALWPLDPNTTTPVRKDGVLRYSVETQGAAPQMVAAENILHIKGFTTDGICGVDLVGKARETIGLGMAGTKYQAVFFRNGSKPAVVLHTDQVVPEDQRKRLGESWERGYGGIENQHRTAILDRGLQAQILTFSPEASQLIEQLQATALSVALFTGIPPHKLGVKIATSYSSLESENTAYLTDALDGWLIPWEEEARDKLLTETEKADDSHEVRFNRKEIIRIDARTAAEVNRIALAGSPYKTVNEVRREEGLEPQDGGDEIQQPMNMGKPGGNPDFTKDGQEPAPAKKEKAARDPRLAAPLRAALADACRRVVRRVAVQADKFARKGGAKYCEWLTLFRGANLEAACEITGPAEAAVTVYLGAQQIPGTLAAELLEEMHRRLDRVAGEATAARLAPAVSDELAQMEQEMPDCILGDYFGAD